MDGMRRRVDVVINHLEYCAMTFWETKTCAPAEESKVKTFFFDICDICLY